MSSQTVSQSIPSSVSGVVTPTVGQSCKHAHLVGGPASTHLAGVVDYTTYLKILPTPPSLESIGEQNNVVPNEVLYSYF